MLANAAGLWVVPIPDGFAARGLILKRDELHYPAHVAEELQEAFVLREVAKWVLYWYREPRNAASIKAMTLALRRRPQATMVRELRGSVG